MTLTSTRELSARFSLSSTVASTVSADLVLGQNAGSVTLRGPLSDVNAALSLVTYSNTAANGAGYVMGSACYEFSNINCDVFCVVCCTSPASQLRFGC